MSIRAKGRYASTDELIDSVWYNYIYTGSTYSDIARQCGVSMPTVDKILRHPKPEKYCKIKRECQKIGARNIMIGVEE